MPNFKDHPIYAAGVGFVAGAGFAMTLLWPAYKASLEDKLERTIALKEAAEKKIETNEAEFKGAKAKLESDLNAANARIVETNSRVTELSGKLASAQQAAMFLNKNPYADGLGKVKVGDPIDAIEKAYPTGSIKKNRENYEVQDQHSFFTRVSYGFDDDAKEKRVRVISFRPAFAAKTNEMPEFVTEKLVEAFGPPTERSQALGARVACRWKLNDKVWLYKTERNEYQLFPANATPLYWRDKKPTDADAEKLTCG